MARSRPSDSCAGSENIISTVLEWSRILWPNSGSGKMTVDLGLWWWAIQSYSIKEGSKYTPLGERKWRHSTEFESMNRTSQGLEGLETAQTELLVNVK